MDAVCAKLKNFLMVETSKKLLMLLFMTYTMIIYHAQTMLATCAAITVALTPDRFKRCLYTKKRCKNMPVVVMARGFSSKTETSYDITDFMRFFLNIHWDPMA